MLRVVPAIRRQRVIGSRPCGAHVFTHRLDYRAPGRPNITRSQSSLTQLVHVISTRVLKRWVFSPPSSQASSAVPSTQLEEMAKGQSQTPAMLALRSVQRMLGLVPASDPKNELEEPVFVCIDCEAFEHAHNKITEVGVAVLDTRHLTGINPGDDGDEWIAKMQYAHYRPVEYAYLRNKNFILGCAESFNFGASTWIHLTDAKRILINAFRYPSQLCEAANFAKHKSGSERNIVFVGHNASSDKTFMTQLGFSLSADATVSRTVDTQHLAGGTKKSAIGLHRLLISLEVEPFNLHNAGNDAAYTLQAMVKMAVRDHASAGSVHRKLASAMGKLPPLKYNRLVAPQVWAGTAVEQTTSTGQPAAKATSKAATPGQPRMGRRDRKRALRAAQSTAGASALEDQKPLPSTSSLT
jgi:DNA polymerase III epsilon subunit-like protein